MHFNLQGENFNLFLYLAITYDYVNLTKEIRMSESIPPADSIQSKVYIEMDIMCPELNRISIGRISDDE